MTTCGMYDYAGEWVYRVGLPAKSGVAGGILAVLPGQLAIGVFSPPLDERGNSVRGVAVCEALSEELGLHFLGAPRAAIAAVRSRWTLQALGSKRARRDLSASRSRRTAAEAVVVPAPGRPLLRRHGGRAPAHRDRARGSDSLRARLRASQRRRLRPLRGC